MRTVALITQKGGSGKSTLSASLAVAAQGARERVFLIDMDPQKSLATWAQNRSDDNLGVEAIYSSKLPRVMETLAASQISLTIIDTPAGLTLGSEAAMRAADLVLIPVRPTVFDIWASEATRRRARGGRLRSERAADALGVIVRRRVCRRSDPARHRRG